MGSSKSKPVTLVDLSASLSSPPVSFASVFSRPLSAHDVFDSWTVSGLRQALTDHRSAVDSLIVDAIDTLSRTSTSVGTTTGSDSAKEKDMASSAIRFLTRVLPILFEDSQRADQLLWGNSDGAATTKVEEEEDEHQQPPQAPAEAPGLILLDAIGRCAFLADFCVNEFGSAPADAAGWARQSSPPAGAAGGASDAAPRSRSRIPHANVWAPGIGVDEVFPADAVQVERRTELLRLLLVLLSQSMYLEGSSSSSDGESPPTPNRWAEQLCTRRTAYTKPLILSLVNFVCHPPNSSWSMPFKHLFVSGSEDASVKVALHVLVFLLEYGSVDGSTAGRGLAPDALISSPATGSDGGPAPAHTSGTNVMRDALVDAVASDDDRAFLFAGVTSLLNRSVPAMQSYLSSSGAPLACQQEALMLAWQFVRCIPDLVYSIVHDQDVLRLVVPVLILLHEGRNDDTQIGLVHLGTFMLLVLSGERDFGVALNKEVEYSPSDLPQFRGSVGDLLVLVFARLMVDGHERIESLYECMLTIVSNVSPYIKSLGSAASSKVVQLFDMLSKDKFLFANERNHRYVFFLLEACNNLVQYQYEGNARIIYDIVRSADSFERLAKLQVPSGLEEMVVEDGFEVSQEWLDSWKPELPLGTLLRLIDFLVPRVQALCGGEASDEAKIMTFLKDTTLVGVLPVPHPILIRRYQQNAATDAWFRTYMHGCVYLGCLEPPIFFGTAVTMFTVSLDEDSSDDEE